MHHTPTSSVASLLTLIAFLERRGVQRAQIAGAAGCAASCFDDPDARIDYWSIQKIWAFTVSHLDLAAPGLEVGAAVKPANLGIVGYVMLNAATLDASLERLCHYHALISEGIALRRVRTERLIGIACSPYRADIAQIREPTDAFFAALVTVLRQFAGSTLWAARVDLCYAIDETAPYKRHLGVVPERCETPSTLWFDRTLLSTPVIGADAPLFTLLQSRADALLAALESEGFIARCHHAISSMLLAYEVPTVEKLSDAMGLGVRTLQHKLAEHGTGFRALLEESRKALAKSALGQGMTASDVAFLLGYREISSFNKAFRKWFGVTPTQMRGRV